MAKQNTGGGLLTGTLIGATVGAVGALLLAPKSGAKLREELSCKLQNVGSKTKDIASAITSNTKDVLTAAKDEASGLASQAKQSNDRLKDSMSSAKDDIKERMESREMSHR